MNNTLGCPCVAVPVLILVLALVHGSASGQEVSRRDVELELAARLGLPGGAPGAAGSAESTPPVDWPPHAAAGKFEDRGVLFMKGTKRRDGSAREVPIWGSDPEWESEGSGSERIFHLFHTFGPTRPATKGTPGIYHHTSRGSLRGPYSAPEIILRPEEDAEFGDNWGVETFSTVREPELGLWIALYHGYSAFGTSTNRRSHNALYLATATGLNGPWTKRGPVVTPSFLWELGFVRSVKDRSGSEVEIELGNYSEPGLAWDPRVGLVCTYSAESDKPDGMAWRTGIMFSRSGGRSWYKRPEPILVPPARYAERSGNNSISHSCTVMDPRGGMHIFFAFSGHSPKHKKGIAHAFTLDYIHWSDPQMVLAVSEVEVELRDGRKVSADHIGGPSVHLDLEARVFEMVYHADTKRQAAWQEGGGRHSRYAVMEL